MEEEQTQKVESPPPKKVSTSKGQPEKKKVKEKENSKPKKLPQREYLGWKDANNIEWRTYMEYKGYKNWLTKFGPETEWGNRYRDWICSGMTRGAMRKPSFRGIEWVKYQRGIEVAPVGECCTRNRYSIRDYFMEPLDNYCCRPCPWPKVTSGEVGWLGQHKSCQLEIYPNDFMKKPPLPRFQRKISSFLPGNM